MRSFKKSNSSVPGCIPALKDLWTTQGRCQTLGTGASHNFDMTG